VRMDTPTLVRDINVDASSGASRNLAGAVRLRLPQDSSVQGCNSVHFQGFDHAVEDEADPYRGDKEPNDAGRCVDPRKALATYDTGGRCG
jgi:hypothetical protein